MLRQRVLENTVPLRLKLRLALKVGVGLQLRPSRHGHVVEGDAGYMVLRIETLEQVGRSSPVSDFDVGEGHVADGPKPVVVGARIRIDVGITASLNSWKTRPAPPETRRVGVLHSDVAGTM